MNMLRGRLYLGFVAALGLGPSACTSSALTLQSMASPDGSAGDGSGGDNSEIIVQAYEAGLAQVHATKPDLQLGIVTDAEARGPVLTVKYPAPTADPAARDVNCDAENQDWTAGGAITFQIKPALPLNFSLSFLDRNQIAYTTWTDLRGGVWQQMRIPFADMVPNPYF